MMNDDRTRIVPWSHQGAAYTGEAIENTKVQFYHITQIRSFTSDKYTKESASGEIGSGITMLGLEYDGIKDLDLQSYYYYAPDLYSTFFTQADYNFIIDEDNRIWIIGVIKVMPSTSGSLLLMIFKRYLFCFSDRQG